MYTVLWHQLEVDENPVNVLTMMSWVAALRRREGITNQTSLTPTGEPAGSSDSE